MTYIYSDGDDDEPLDTDWVFGRDWGDWKVSAKCGLYVVSGTARLFDGWLEVCNSKGEHLGEEVVDRSPAFLAPMLLNQLNRLSLKVDAALAALPDGVSLSDGADALDS